MSAPPRHFVLRRPWASFRLARRGLLAGAALVTAILVVVLLSLLLGDYPLGAREFGAILLGQGEGLARTVVLDWRLPRVLAALLCGAALGLAGAIFQSITRNPLGSPDIIGFSAGSYSGALVVIIFWTSSYAAIALGALLGGLATAFLVYLLAYRAGIQGFRLIVVGIAVAAVLGSLNTWMMLRSDSDLAFSAAAWGAGSLNGIGWGQTIPVALVLAALLPAVALFGRDLHQMELGDDAARAGGVPVERSRLALIVLGVALTASVTAIAGPIAFIALAAPQIGRRLARSQGTALVPAALAGALLLLTADLLSQRLFAPRQWPVGIMTVSVGGLYLLWLLVRQNRAR